MPLADEPESPSRTILDALAPDTFPFAGRAKGEVVSITKLLAKLETAVRDGDPSSIPPTVDDILTWYKRGPVETMKALADRLDDAASIDDRLQEHAGVALSRAGSVLWGQKLNDEASVYYRRAEARLGPLTSARALQCWSEAASSLASLLRAESLDDAALRFEALFRKTNEHPINSSVRYWTIFAARRVAASLCDSGRAADALAITSRALTLSLEGYALDAYWYEHWIQVHCNHVLALRFLERYREAIAAAEKALAFDRFATNDAAAVGICWIYAEAVFIAVDKLSDPATAMPFFAALREKAKHPKAAKLVRDVSYGVAMEAKALLLLGKSDDALKSCVDAIEFAGRCAPPELGFASWACALAIRGNALDAQGDRAGAEAAWREAIERFGANDDSNVRDEVAKSRAALAR